MEWFTLGPKALEQLRTSTEALRTRLGTARATERVQQMDPAELADFVNEVLALMDESEAILKRVRPEAPRRKPLPNPIEDRVVEAKPVRELRPTRAGLPSLVPERPAVPTSPPPGEVRSTRKLPNPFAALRRARAD